MLVTAFSRGEKEVVSASYSRPKPPLLQSGFQTSFPLRALHTKLSLRINKSRIETTQTPGAPS